MAYIVAGTGFEVGADFTRVLGNTPCEVAADEYAKPGYVIVYIATDPDSPLAFMRYGTHKGLRVRCHVRKSSVQS